MADLESLHSTNLQKNVQVQVYISVMLRLLVTYRPALLGLLQPFCTYSKNIYNQLFMYDIHLILMPKVNIYALD